MKIREIVWLDFETEMKLMKLANKIGVAKNVIISIIVSDFLGVPKSVRKVVQVREWDERRKRHVFVKKEVEINIEYLRKNLS